MPTVLVIDGYRFFFYSNEGSEPPHIHVEKGEAVGKWWLTPVRLGFAEGFRPAQVRRVHTIVKEHEGRFLEAWHEYFG